MTTLIKQVKVFDTFEECDVYVDDLGATTIAQRIDLDSDILIDGFDLYALPSLILPYVKEDIKEEVLIKGGFSTVCKEGAISSFYTKINYHKILSVTSLEDVTLADCFLFRLDTHEDVSSILQAIKQRNGLLLMDYNKELLEVNRSVGCSIHIMDIDVKEIQSIKEYQTFFPLTCGVKMSTLLNEIASYIKWIEEDVIECIHIDDHYEYAFALLYTKLVNKRYMSLKQLCKLVAYNIADIFGMDGGEFINYQENDFFMMNCHVNDRLFSKEFIVLDESLVNEYVNCRIVYHCMKGFILYNII